MSKVELQKSIREDKGFVLSEGTLNLNHLLASAYDLIVSYDLKGNPYSYISTKSFRQEILDCFWLSELGNPKEDGLYRMVYFGKAEIPFNTDKERNAHYVWEDASNYFNDIAPPGYYFGSSEGDGAMIGWFQIEENGEEF